MWVWFDLPVGLHERLSDSLDAVGFELSTGLVLSHPLFLVLPDVDCLVAQDSIDLWAGITL